MRNARLPALTVLVTLALAAAATAEHRTTFVFGRLNGTFTNLAGDIREARAGVFTVRSNSPTNRFEILGHRLDLTCLGEGIHRAEVWVQFEGEADVEAELLMAGVSAGTVTDEVLVPDQERRVDSRIRIDGEEEDYLITVVETPRDFQVAIQSRLASQVVSLCEGFARFAFGASCGALEESLSNPRIPMPEPGEQYILPSGELTADERAQLEAYLDGCE